MPLEKAMIINPAKPKEPHKVIYNPPSLKIASSNTYADLKNPGGALDKQQFVKNNCDVLTVDLFFDITRQPLDPENPTKLYTDVRELVNPILALAKVPKDKKEPPKLKFAWGQFSFDCVIISIDHTYDYFSSSGNALRATLNVKFRRVEPAAAAPAKAAADTAAKKVVEAGQDVVCFCADPKDWRSVCEANNIDNPFLVSSGEMVGEALVCK